MIPQIVMVTCDRKPEYVHESLRSMLEDQMVEHVDLVLCGASERGFLASWESDSRVTIHEATEPQKLLSRGSHVERRILFTFMRALELAEDGKTLLFFEDDVVFAKGWLQKAHAFDYMVKKRFVHSGSLVDRYILSLYSPYCVKSDRSCGQHSIAEYHPSDFHCTAGFMLEAPIARELLGYACDKVSHGEFLASDMMIKHFTWEKKVDLLASNPSIVDHVGDQSSQGFFGIRRAPTFERE